MITTRSLAAAMPPAAPSRLAAVLATLKAWIARPRQRQALAALDARLLKDIGLTANEAVAESRKPFWR